MLKKIIAIMLILIGNVSNAFAGSFYLGPSLIYQNTYTRLLRYESFNPGGFFGYGSVIQESMYFGGELFANVRTESFNNKTNNNLDLKNKYSYGFSLIPGFFFDPTFMGYARIGFIQTRFNQPSSTKNGWQFGGGLEMSLTSNWNARAEFDYIKYQALTKVIGSPGAIQFGLSAVYRVI